MADAFSGYHPQDRTVIVSLVWEDAFLQNAVAVTALTALFYDAQRALGPPFYTYPSHYLLACKGADGIRTRGGAIPLSVQEAGRPWGHLDLWPDTQWIEASRVLAEHLIEGGGQQPEQRIRYLSELVLSHDPSPRMESVLQHSLKQMEEHYTADPHAARELIAVGEKPRNPAIPAPELAAWTMVVSEMMNLDETLNK